VSPVSVRDCRRDRSPVASFAVLSLAIARGFQGARAGDLPIEMPTHVELAINFRTAKALDLIVPPMLLLLLPMRSSNSARLSGLGHNR
jgi:hypothetical protein